jgi:uncharacterized protein with ParB-like and HNH nuclease domain
MAYQTTTIIDIVRKVLANTLCLPSIQRKFIWTPEKIEKLFDSIYSNYPIGTFLFWDVHTERINDYSFYLILKEYHERDHVFNDQAPNPIPNMDILAILDGQQRITAIAISLLGHLTIKRPRAHGYKPNAYQKKQLYFNLLGFSSIQENNFDNDDSNRFRMFTEEEVRDNKSENELWHPVKSFIDPKWSTQNPQEKSNLINILLDQKFNREKCEQLRRDAIVYPHVFTLVDRIWRDQFISYYRIDYQIELDEVAEIFIRLNSGGIPLSKSDLLFSTIIARWENGRQVIDNLILEVKSIGYEIDTDFVMRTCLYLTESDILFKVNNFRQDTIDKIIDQFENPYLEHDIKTSIYEIFEFLRKALGIADKTLKSKNAIIPIIYHYFKGGLIENDDSIKGVIKFLYVSFLNRTFGSHGDSLLRQLREGCRVEDNHYLLYQQPFDFKTLIAGIRDNTKRYLYEVNEQNINDYLNLKKGEESWLVLSLIYPPLNHQYSNYDQDHLHPRSRILRANFESEEAYIYARDRKDMIPNLALLTPSDNRHMKRDCTLIEYFNNVLSDQGRRTFNNDNFIADFSLELNNFRQFFDSRREIMASILRRELLSDQHDNNNEIQINPIPTDPDPVIIPGANDIVDQLPADQTVPKEHPNIPPNPNIEIINGNIFSLMEEARHYKPIDETERSLLESLVPWQSESYPQILEQITSKRLHKDVNWMRHAVTKTPALLIYLLTDRYPGYNFDYITTVLASAISPKVFSYLLGNFNYEYLKEVRNTLIIDVLKLEGLALESLPYADRSNRHYVETAIRQNGYSLKYALGELNNDDSIVRMSVEKTVAAFIFISDRWKDDREFAYYAVNKDGMCIKYVSDRLKYSDKELIIAAVTNNGMALQWIPATWKNDEEVVRAAISNNYLALQHASPEMRIHFANGLIG